MAFSTKIEPSRMDLEEKYKASSERLNKRFVEPENRNDSTGRSDDFIPVINEDKWSLALEATEVDVLDKMLDILGLEIDTEELVTWFSEAKHMCESNEIHIPDGQSKEEALWRTLIADLTDTEHPDPEEYAKGFEIWHSVNVCKRKFEDSEKGFSVIQVANLSRLSLTYQREFLATCRGRKFGITSGGRLVLVPPRSSPGDVVCVIRGVHTPFVVRPMRQEAREMINAHTASSKGLIGYESSLEGEHQLVGECYVHGIMDGEAVPTEFQKLTLV